MNLAGLLVFAAAYLAVVILPGPGVTALIARVLARGTQGAPAFVAGCVAGSLVWFTVAATGLAAIAATFADLFVAIRYAGAAYLVYLAWKLWTAPIRPLAINTGQGRPSPTRHLKAHRRKAGAASSWPASRSTSATPRPSCSSWRWCRRW